MGDDDRIPDRSGYWLASFADIDVAAEDCGSGAPVQGCPIDPADCNCVRPQECPHRQVKANHPAERELLVGWAAGRDVQPGDPYVRLNLAVAFIAQHGLAAEFARFLRSQ